MNTPSIISYASLSILFAASFGCGGGPSTDEALDRLKNPTGSFSASNGSLALSSYKKKNNSGSFASGFGGGSSVKTASVAGMKNLAALTQRGLDLRDAQSISAAGSVQCTAKSNSSASCTCQNGGTVDAEIEQSDGELKVNASYSNCKIGSEGFDGKLSMRQSAKELLASDKLGKVGASAGGVSSAGANLLLAMKGKVTTASASEDVDLALLIQGSAVWLSVNVSDKEYITVGVSANVIEVKSKNGTAVCETKGGSVACEANGQAFSFENTAGIGAGISGAGAARSPQADPMNSLPDVPALPETPVLPETPAQPE
jgi:hypothetical protein